MVASMVAIVLFAWRHGVVDGSSVDGVVCFVSSRVKKALIEGTLGTLGTLGTVEVERVP